MLPTVAVIASLPNVKTSLPKRADIKGMIINQTKKEPAQMIAEYFKPMI